MPVLYTWARAVVVIEDWNDTLVVDKREGLNFFVPCYFNAFPPYHAIRGTFDEGTCPYLVYMSDQQVG
jgi:hypothetical protein